MRNLPRICSWAFSALAILASWSCNPIAPKGREVNILSLQLPDSLTGYDTIKVMLMDTAGREALETLWSAPMPMGGKLGHLEAKRYYGEPLVLKVEGVRKEGPKYQVLVYYRNAETPPRIDPIPGGREPDLPPVLSMTGADTLDLAFGEVFREPGIACHDDREGDLQVQVSGSVLEKPGFYRLRYDCQDSAAQHPLLIRERVIHVWEPQNPAIPDTVAPIISFDGADTLVVREGQSIPIQGSCVDAKDGTRPLSVTGAVGPALGGYAREYACTDSAGNRAARSRWVRLVSGDTVKPVITFVGPDTLPLVKFASFRNPGGKCVDDRDGELVLTERPVNLSTVPDSGFFGMAYSCQDAAGNSREAVRVLKIGVYAQNLKPLADAAIDTSDQARNPNHGYSGILAFSAYPTDNYMSFVKFDLSRIRKSDLKSAKLHFFTYAAGTGWSTGFKALRFHPFSMHTAWIEGTGNWYWNETFWQNGGNTLYQNYGLSDSVFANSTNPLYPNGVSPANKSIVRDANLSALAVRNVQAYFPKIPAVGTLPQPADLTVVEIDITEFVKEAKASDSEGFLIKIEGLDKGQVLGFLTKEMGNGEYAPRLMLTY